MKLFFVYTEEAPSDEALIYAVLAPDKDAARKLARVSSNARVEFAAEFTRDRQARIVGSFPGPISQTPGG